MLYEMLHEGSRDFCVCVCFTHNYIPNNQNRLHMLLVEQMKSWIQRERYSRDSKPVTILVPKLLISL